MSVSETPGLLKRMLTIREAAMLLGVHPNTLRTWSTQGRLRCYRFSTRGDRRFRWEDLEAFITSHQDGALKASDH